VHERTQALRVPTCLTLQKSSPVEFRLRQHSITTAANSTHKSQNEVNDANKCASKIRWYLPPSLFVFPLGLLCRAILREKPENIKGYAAGEWRRFLCGVFIHVSDVTHCLRAQSATASSIPPLNSSFARKYQPKTFGIFTCYRRGNLS
jgi:hypothetical protein